LNELAAGGESAVLVHIDFRNPQFHEDLDEFIQLAEAAGLTSDVIITSVRSVPDARFFIGRGKVAEVKQRICNTDADLVIFNHILTPAQERNLERELKCRVLDRVRLILDIFAQRARSYEGKLQVELAQLQHLSSRLIRGWTHLERQKGGIGLRGPGEKQLETDRRLLSQRIKSINRRLDKVRRQRQQGRRLRQRKPTPVISLVGYTNAGKSTLFKRLTRAAVYASDKLFATLDTTLRRLELAPGQTVVLSDTVGFIRHIPHDLVAAFRATLEEVREADLLLHVIDVNDEHRQSHMQQVDAVIEEIGATEVPQILVFNKIDLNEQLAVRVEAHADSMAKIWLSAHSGAGLDALKALINSHISPKRRVHRLHLPAGAGKFRASLFQSGVVCEEQLASEGGWLIEIRLEPAALDSLCRKHGLDLAMLQ